MSVKVAGESLAAERYEVTDKKLTLTGLPAGAFEVEIETEIKPQVQRQCAYCTIKSHSCPCKHVLQMLLAPLSVRREVAAISSHLCARCTALTEPGHLQVPGV